MMYCPRCSAAFEHAAKTCAHCGAILVDNPSSVSCPTCGKQNRDDRNTCWNCRATLDGTESSPAAAEATPLSDEESAVLCPHCGQRNRPNKKACWACLKSFDGSESAPTRARVIRLADNPSAVLCPHCGKQNWNDRETCWNCEARLDGSSADSGDGAAVARVAEQRLGSSTTGINYGDFGVCRRCKRIRVKTERSCRHCGCADYAITIGEASGGCAPYVAYLVVGGIICLIPAVGIPIGLLVAGGGCCGVARKQKARENELRLEALRLYERIAQSQHDDARSKEQRGTALAEQGEYQEAVPQLLEARAMGSANTQTTLALATSYYNMDNYTDAIPLLREYVAGESEDKAAKEMLARSYLAACRVEAADPSPDTPEVPSGSEVTRDEIANLLIDVREYAAPKLRQDIVLFLASSFVQEHREDATATDVLREAVGLEPDNALYLGQLCTALLNQGALDEVATVAEAISIEKHTDVGILAYARALAATDDTSAKSIPVYERYLSLMPDDTDVRVRLCEAYNASGQASKAAATCSAGLSRDPNNVGIRYQLALTNLMSDSIEDAIGELQTIMRTDGYDSYISKNSAYRVLGRCFVKKGMLDTALKQYLLSDRSADTLDQIYDLGAAFEAKGESEKARACWEEIYATDVRYRDVASKLS